MGAKTEMLLDSEAGPGLAVQWECQASVRPRGWETQRRRARSVSPGTRARG